MCTFFWVRGEKGEEGKIVYKYGTAKNKFRDKNMLRIIYRTQVETEKFLN
jgi:hypothetical protein